jgi:hypothetical protein
VKRRTVLQALAALGVVWTAVWILTQLSAAAIPSAQRLLGYLGTQPLASGGREAVLARVAQDYNELPFLEKRALRAPEANGSFNAFLEQLTPAEKASFVERVLPQGFRDLLAGFAKMPERDRQKTIERSRREILEHLGDSPARALLENADPALLKQIANGGLGPMFDALPPDAKLQMLPMIEQMQNNLRQLRD